MPTSFHMLWLGSLQGRCGRFCSLPTGLAHLTVREYRAVKAVDDALNELVARLLVELLLLRVDVEDGVEREVFRPALGLFGVDDGNLSFATVLERGNLGAMKPLALTWAVFRSKVMHGPRPSFFSFVLKGRIRTTTMTVSPPFSRFAAISNPRNGNENRKLKCELR